MVNEEIEIQHSKWIMGSYGVGAAINQFFRMAFIAFGFYFYEVEIGLNVWLTTLGYILFAIWNAVNDPLIGYLTNRPFKFTKKWGRRFPWMMIGGVPWVASYILVFAPPIVDPVSSAWIIFAWLVLTTCLFDTFNSIWWVGFYSLFPDKFRSLKERRTASGIVTPIGIVGIALGGIIPPLFITYGVPSSFLIQAGVVSLIAFIMLLLGIPGWRDDPESVDRYLAKCEEEEEMPKESFFKTMSSTLHQKSFLLLLIIYLTWQILTFCIQASIPYLIRFVLKMPASAQLFLQVGFLIGAVFSIPLWIKLAHKLNNNKNVYVIAGVVLVIFTIPLSFVTEYFMLLIIFILWGIGLGGFWALNRIILSDVVDESVANTGKREEGIYSGIFMFFNRLAIIVQVIIFATVHTLTGFAEGADTQSPQAQWGIQLHMGIIPMFILLIGILLFWKFYDLTPSKIEKVRDKLKKLEL
jgi:GPH family glycoside/pentoside/hexuronide:cation symporter